MRSRLLASLPTVAAAAIPALGVAALTAWLAGCSGSSAEGGGDGSTLPASTGETGALVGITAAHNRARAEVSPPPAAPMPPLTWSDSVAAVAQAWAAGCRFDHNPSTPYGENIFASSGQSTAESVVADWVSEKAGYDYATNRCSGFTCGHYTQVVWAKSLRLGCAVQNCTKNSPFGGGAWQLWVCDYDPPGNFGSQRPY